uniref:hypothetical protein n=1 Tax=Pararhizobium sp. IMCC3301 TaxID=3067904 RepID=UPI0027421694|nr:hypothetical protein [Pararhizobium sp. IMCC3301]
MTAKGEVAIGKAFVHHKSFSRAILLCAAFLLPVAANGQSGEDRSAKISGDAFVRAFLSDCATSIGDYDRIVAASKALGYAALSEEAKSVPRPQDPNAEFIGFYAHTGEAAPYALALSKTVMDGQFYTVCYIINPFVNVAEVVAALQPIVQTGILENDATALDQRFRVWFVDEWSKGAYISLMSGELLESGGAILTLMAPAKN